MKLICLGTGSKGNCYLLKNSKEVLVLDCGINYKEVIKKLDFNIKKIKGVLVTHEHQDHAKYIKNYLEAGIPVYGTASIKEKYKNYYNLRVVKKFGEYKIGEFVVKAFDLPHDGTENYGYYIQHEEFGKMLYMTDFEYCRYNFKQTGINHILIEANYDDQYVNIHAANYSHVRKGHCEITTTINFLKANYTEYLKNVILLHLSQANSNEVEFKQKVEQEISCNVAVANKKLEMEI